MSIINAQYAQKVPDKGPLHWSVDMFYRAIAADVFDDAKRLELISGELREKEPVNPPHASLIRRIARLIRASFEPSFLVLQESPLHVSSDSELIPDVYVARGTEEDYVEQHPTAEDVVLLIEVADTSVIRDTVEKARLYAQASISDYWVSLIGARELLVFRNPASDGYQEVLRLSESDFIRPLVAPNISFSVRDLVVRRQTSMTDLG